MKCTKLTIEKTSDLIFGKNFIENFEEKHDIDDILEYCLVEDLEDENCQIIYFVLEDNNILEDFIYDLIEYQIKIIDRTDFSSNLFNIIKNQKVDKFKQKFEYTIGFENILENFYNKTSTNVIL